MAMLNFIHDTTNFRPTGLKPSKPDGFEVIDGRRVIEEMRKKFRQENGIQDDPQDKFIPGIPLPADPWKQLREKLTPKPFA